MYADTVEALFQPEMVLPAQVPARGGTRHCPELRLVAAIFEDAVRSVSRFAGHRRGRRRREFLEAWEWLFSDDRTWPFAFTNVCEVLGLDDVAVRQRLLLSTAAPPRPAQDASEERDDRQGSAGEPRKTPPARDRTPALERCAFVGWDEV
jgi:hypothetical protein